MVGCGAGSLKKTETESDRHFLPPVGRYFVLQRVASVGFAGVMEGVIPEISAGGVHGSEEEEGEGQGAGGAGGGQKGEVKGVQT